MTITAITVERKESKRGYVSFVYRDQDRRIVRKSQGNEYAFAVAYNDQAYSFSRNRKAASATASRHGGHVITITREDTSTMTAKTITPDPKPTTKPRTKRVDPKKADLDATPSKVDTEETVSVDPAEPKSAADKIRKASSAALKRREKNAADKAKLAETKAAERTEREQARETFTKSVVDHYAATKSVKDTAAAFVNPATSKPYSEMRIRRILNAAGVLEVTKRGDTSERDEQIVESLKKGETVTNVSVTWELSAARVRAIGRKGGVEGLAVGRQGKLPEAGSKLFADLERDVAELTEKWGVALGTIAHAMRRANA